MSWHILNVTAEASGKERAQLALEAAARYDRKPGQRVANDLTVNWFDKEDYKPDHYSIKDTMGALSQNSQTAAILGKMMERMSASRGDVAKSAGGNASLQKMMAGMTLESLIKQAGDSVPEAMIRQLNAALQRIRKK